MLEPLDTARDEPTRVDRDASASTAKLAPGAAAAGRRSALSDRLKREVLHSFAAKLGRYTLLRVLGEGGMGIVFAAYDEELDRKVAIKLLRTPEQGPGFDRSLLLNEARALARLSHPNIVQVYDVGETEDQLFVAMEFVVGETLRDWFCHGERSWREVVAMCIQAGRGLQVAHEAGLVHCDFKPPNVLVGKDGRARVLDFGLAQLRGLAIAHGPNEGTLQTTMTGGTPAYMAPEVHQQAPSDPRSDQFAFCVVLHEGLFGQRPFAGSTPEELRQAICADAVVPPPGDTRVPGRLRRAVLRGLSHDPAARWPNMQALLAELEQDPERARRRWGLAGGLTASLALAAFGGWQWHTSTTAAALVRCQAPEAEIAALVGPERRATIRQAILATGLAYAPGSADAVAVALDDFVARSTLIHAAACEGVVIEASVTPDMMVLRDRCAAQQRDEVDATIEVLLAADAVVVENISEIISQLPEPESCNDLRILANMAHESDAEAREPRRKSMRASLVQVMAEANAGHYQAAEAQVVPLLAEVEALHDRALRSEVREVAAQCAVYTGAYGRAEELYLGAITDALASDHVFTAAKLANEMTFFAAFRRGQVAEGPPLEPDRRGPGRAYRERPAALCASPPSCGDRQPGSRI